MIAMPDGSLVLRLGQGMDPGGAIRRVAPDGTLDETFTARVHAVYPDTTRRPTLVAEPGMGRLLLVDAVDAGLRVRRFQADGRPDPSFGDIDGMAIVDTRVATGDPDVDGPIVTGGLTWSPGGGGRWLLFGSASTRRGLGNTQVLLRLRADFTREGWTRLPLGFPESPGLPESVRLAPTRDGDLLLLETNGMGIDPANTAQATYIGLARAQLSSGSGPGTLGFAGNGWRMAVSEREGSRTIRVMRSGGRSGAVSVRYRTASGSADADDYVAAQGTLSWPDGDDSPRAIPFTVRDDALLEGEETVRVQLYEPVGAAVASGELTVHVEDDEAIRALRFERSEYWLVEGFGSLIDVRPVNPLPKPVTARFVVSGPDGLVAGANTVRLRWEAGSVERRSGYLVGNGNPRQVDGERRGTLLLADALGPITAAAGGPAASLVVADATPTATPTPSSPAPAGTGGTGSGSAATGGSGGGGALDVATLALLVGALFAGLRRQRAGRRRVS
jgi:hypothetical protein